MDDVMNLPALDKAGRADRGGRLMAVLHGVVIHVLTNPACFTEHQVLESWAIWPSPVTVLWIVGCTNSVNLIDGLDGLACGVSVISATTMLVVALLVAEGNVAIILAALTGACIGFLPYNVNPAKLFMGDTGSQLLGLCAGHLSVMGMFKYYAVVTFIVPVLAWPFRFPTPCLPFFRRLFHGQSPFKADRGHFHHKLLDMGLSQKQAVAVLYSVSAILGLAAVVLAPRGDGGAQGARAIITQEEAPKSGAGGRFGEAGGRRSEAPPGCRRRNRRTPGRTTPEKGRRAVMEKLRILSVFGTRPEAIKMAPLVRELASPAPRSKASAA
jgi:UDP-GlcNAc:undecaprenyl-phosphate GlcNAc-1-phosphate transferase